VSAERLELIEQLDDRLKVAELGLRRLDRPWNALTHLGYRLRVAVAALRPRPGRRD
jgi:hypothetical protein